MLGGFVLIMLMISAALAPWIAPYSYSYQDLNLGASPPSGEHLLGTDILGRDLLSRILYGARISLLVGFVATGVALVIGVSWGIIAGYMGGRVDSIMMRIVDVLYGLPFIIFIILLMVIFGRNLWLLFGAIGAGMSGGIAYVLDPKGNFSNQCNMDSFELESVKAADDILQLKSLIKKHFDYTQSDIAKNILENWETSIPKFVKVMPTEYKRVLQERASATAA